MSENIEIKLAKLEQEIKSLKAISPISGTLVRMYFQSSQQFLVGGTERYQTVRIKFTPRYKTSNLGLYTLSAFTIRSGWLERMGSYVERQDGSGDIIIRILMCMVNDQIVVTAKGSSPGTFTRIS